MANPLSPEVSIVIPAYKTAGLIAACLDSVFAQTYANFEAIVVNDGCPETPSLEKALAPYLDRIVYIRQENKRAAGARNTAIRNARGNFLAFLDSDDTWLPGHLESQMKLFDQDPSLDLVYSDAYLTGDVKPEIKFSDKYPSQGVATFDSLVMERCQIPVSTVVARKAAIVKAGLFDEDLGCYDDYDMWLRTAFHGGKIGYTHEGQVRLSGRRPGCLSESVSKMAGAYCGVLEKIGRTLPLSQSQQELLANRLIESTAFFQLEEGKKQLQKRQYGMAKELLREANRHFHRPVVNIAVFALGLAPDTTFTLISTWRRIRYGKVI